MEFVENKIFKSGPNIGGESLEIPQTLSTRWIPRRKAQVVAAVSAGVLSLDEACTRYALTEAEFRSWQTAINNFGLAGLRATHALDYRTRKMTSRASSG